MQSLQYKNNEVRKIIKNINLAKNITKNNQPEVLGLLLLLCQVFKENSQSLLLQEQCDKNDVPATPCILAVGGCSVLSASRFYIAVDKQVVIKDIILAEDALALLFASYYVFNIEYPANGTVTMEFLQRAFAEVEGGGAKIIKNGRKKSRINGINSKLLSLLNAVNDFVYV
uniref:Uncharacterized protein n=2 Tax=Ciona savignyi TaxID=51511 RepID=H2YVL5_CIOSA